MSPLFLQRSIIGDGICSAHRQLRHPRRQVELAGRDDPYVYVYCRLLGGHLCTDRVCLLGLYLILCVTFWYYPGMSQFWPDMALVARSVAF